MACLSSALAYIMTDTVPPTNPLAGRWARHVTPLTLFLGRFLGNFQHLFLQEKGRPCSQFTVPCTCVALGLDRDDSLTFQ